MVGKDQAKPSYHCVCRPGNAAVAAGVCVPQQCTLDIAKVAGGTHARRRHLADEKAAIQAAVAAQEKRDGKLDRQWTEEGVKWFNDELASDEGKKDWSHMSKPAQKIITRKDESMIAKFQDDDAVATFALNKGPEKKPLWVLEHLPPKFWTEAGLEWYNSEFTPTIEAPKKGKQLEIAGEILTQIKSSPHGTIFQDSVKADKPYFTEPPADAKDTYKDAVRRTLSSSQKNFNDTFAGRLGIMPSTQIPGGSDSLHQEHEPEYKIKVVLPEQSKVDGSSGKIQIGSEKLPPQLLDSMGKVVEHLSKAEQLKNAMSWNDVKVVHPVRGEIPGVAITCAGLAPGWSHRGDQGRCAAAERSRHHVKQPRCRSNAHWAAFLSPAEQASRTLVNSPLA
jgi:hypothetical protein